MVTLMTKEYKTASSMLLMFRWRISNESLSRTAIIFSICPGIFRAITLRITFDPEILASTSATLELQHAPPVSSLLAALSKLKGLSGGGVTIS